eukprot:CCRYP_008418-RA/>CCRYP_008418-RA protein AED:0.00 eAED:0.00 QI:12/1/1/1/1/0.66/3/0/185
MRLTHATTAITATIPTVALFAITTSCHEVTASVNFYHGHRKANSVRAAPMNDGAECSFVNDFKVHAGVDTGILKCNVEETCIEDKTSAMGGRCSMLDNEEVVDIEVPHMEFHRELDYVCSFSDGTSGVKCVGQFACFGVNNLSTVGCGSCNGNVACFDAAASVIGENSCNGEAACNLHQQSVGRN